MRPSPSLSVSAEPWLVGRDAHCKSAPGVPRAVGGTRDAACPAPFASCPLPRGSRKRLRIYHTPASRRNECPCGGHPVTAALAGRPSSCGRSRHPERGCAVKKKSAPGRFSQGYELAEEGFEPSLPGLRVKRFSRPPHSTTLPPLRIRDEAATVFAGRPWTRVAASSSVSPTRPSASPQLIEQFSWRRDGDSNPRPPALWRIHHSQSRACGLRRTSLRFANARPIISTKQQLSSIQQP